MITKPTDLTDAQLRDTARRSAETILARCGPPCPCGLCDVARGVLADLDRHETTTAGR